MNSKLIKISEHIMFFAIILIIYIGYLMYYPFKVLKNNYEINPVITKQVKAGDKVKFLVDVEHYTDGVKVEVVSQLENGFVYNFPTREYVTVKGKSQFVREIVIPKETHSGKYRIVNHSIFQINPLRKISTRAQTEYFEVIGGDE